MLSVSKEHCVNDWTAFVYISPSLVKSGNVVKKITSSLKQAKTKVIETRPKASGKSTFGISLLYPKKTSLKDTSAQSKEFSLSDEMMLLLNGHTDVLAYQPENVGSCSLSGLQRDDTVA